MLWLAMCVPAVGQEFVAPGTESLGMDHGVAPMTHMGDVGFFSQDLGTLLRLRYNTESYGQNHHGNFDVGTMQVISFDDSILFVDAQVTLNDVQGAGFNVGVGYRWLSFPPYALDAGRMEGISLWVDGTRTAESNFFPQIGVSYESLGDLWDLRANVYIPVGEQDQVGEFRETGEIGFQGNSIAELTQAVQDSSFFAGEVEVARRLGTQRDAWAFAGPYFLANDIDDTVGYRAGLRGYAYPDLLLQFAVSDDEIFNTNATFSVIWFVGRTRTDYQPTCGVPDRLREPVLRNDYVVLAQSTVAGGIPLTQPDGTALRVVHVDSDAAPGGDGSFERPFDMLSDINGTGSRSGDIILAHAESILTGDTSAILKNDQRLLGEGDGFEHMVATAERGTILIPETAPGARDADRPMIVAALGDAIVLAGSNEVNNFDIDGDGITARAITSPAGGSSNPVLRNLNISDTTDDAIFLTVLDFIDINDVDNDGNTTERLVGGNVTIDQVVFDNIGGDDIEYTGTDVDLTQPNVQLVEVLSITNVTTTNGNGRGIAIADTHAGAGRTVTVNNYTYDGGANGLAGIELSNFDSTFNASNATFTNSNATLNEGIGVSILGDSDGTITFASSVVFNNLDGTTFLVDGDTTGNNEFGGTVAVNGNIMNDTGLSVFVRGVGAGSVTFAGDVTDMGGEGIRVQNNGGGLVLFSGDLTLTTGASNAIELTNNDDDMGAAATDIDFTGMLDITTTSGNGFVATDEGNLTVSGNMNSIATQTGRIIQIQDMNIDTLGVNFIDIRRTQVGGPDEAVLLRGNTGGPITLGDPAEDDPVEFRTIQGGGANTVVIDNSANVTLSALIINPTAGTSGVVVMKNSSGTQTVNLNDLQINDGVFGVSVMGGGAGAGALNMTINDTDINDSTSAGLIINNVDAGTIAVNGTTIDGDPANAGADGVRIIDSDATITFDSQTLIQTWADVDFEVTGDVGTINFAGDIVNSDATGRSVHIHDVTAGAVTFTATSSITDDNQGILIEDNSGGTFSFLGTNSIDTVGTDDAVTVRDNTGNVDVLFEDLMITTTGGDGVVIENNASTTSVNIVGVDVTTTTGDAFGATGGGDLTVSGDNNVLATTTGVGLRIEGMNIVDRALFESVTVDGAPNGIVLNNVTGAQITVGEATGAADSGGNLDTTGSAIVLTNVANVDLNNIQVEKTTGAGSDGIAITHTNATTMDVTINDTDIDDTTDDGIVVSNTGSGVFNLNINRTDITDAGGQSVDFATSGSANDVNVRIDTLTANDDFVVTAADNAALDLRIDNSTINANTTWTLNSNGNIDLLVEDSTFDSTVDGGVAFQLDFGASTQDVDAIIRSNDGAGGFTAGLSSAFVMTATGTGANIDFLMDSNVFRNNSAAAETADISVTGGARLDANVVNNTFTQSGTFDAFAMLSDGPTTQINLHLDNNTANGGASADSNDYELTTMNRSGVAPDPFNFSVQDRDNADLRNTGDVNFNPLITDFENITGPVETPVLP